MSPRQISAARGARFVTGQHCHAGAVPAHRHALPAAVCQTLSYSLWLQLEEKLSASEVTQSSRGDREADLGNEKNAVQTSVVVGAR